MVERQQPEQEERESIWSIHKDDLRWYSILFPVWWLVGTVCYSLAVISQQMTLAETIIALIVGIGVVGLSAAVLSLMILAGKGEFVMPLFNRYREKIEQDRQQARQEGRQEGHQEGRAEANAEWLAWYEREKANGGTFENPPSEPGERIDYR